MYKVFILVLLLAAGLRFTALTFDSFWLDEGYQTVVESYGNDLPDLFNPSAKSFLYRPVKPANVKDMLKNFRKFDPLCPPLFAVLMNRWITIFGGTDVSLRAFSVLCSLLSIVAIYIFGSILLGEKAALYAAILQSISPFDIGYAQEARMYSLCALLATISNCSLLCLCLKKFTHKYILLGSLYILATVALINTHYTQIFLWLSGIFIACLIGITKRNWHILSMIIIMNLFILALSLPWADLFLQAAQVRNASFYVVRQPSFWWPIWALLIRIPFNWLSFLAGKKVVFWAIALYITSAVLIALAVYFAINIIKTKVSQSNNKSNLINVILNEPVTLLLAWAILPALMIWILDVLELHKVIEVSRYLIGTAPAIYLLAGYGLYSLFNTRNKNFFIILSASHTFFCLFNNAYLHIVPQKENWRSLAQLLEANCSANDLIFISNYYNIVCLDRYLHKPLKQIGIDKDHGIATIDKQISIQLNQANSNLIFWVLSAQEGDSIFSTIPTKYKLMQSYDFPHALHLRKYQVELQQ